MSPAGGRERLKAIRYEAFGDRERLKLVDLPAPIPGPGEIRVDLCAASVIPADWKLRAGHLTDLFTVTFPKIPGRDGAGIVGAVGPGVDFARVGDAVCVVAQHEEQGTYAEAIVRGRDSVVPKPANLSFAAAAALMHAGVCAWIAVVETLKVAPGMRILIHGGAGAIGGMAIQLARHRGAEVTTTCRAANLDYVRSLGTQHAIAYDREDFVALARGQDAVFDPIGGDTHRRSYSVLRGGGHLAYLIAAPIEDRAAAHGVRLTRIPIHDDIAVLRAVVEAAAAGILTPQISATLPLAAAAEAHRRLEAGEVSRGRLVLLMGDG
jgi:NADPH:quinone reductase-like Zn-dependent oxidoreductase